MKISVFVVIATFLFIACLKRDYLKTTTSPVYQKPKDGLYDSIFAEKNTSKKLEEIEKSVNLVYCQATYKSYVFDYSEKILAGDISESLLKQTDKVQFLQKTVMGTATIILNHNNKIGLLSCAHIFDKPDTIFSYYTDPDNIHNKYIASVSLKQRQTNFTHASNRIGELVVLVSDKENDIAILVNKNKPDIPLPWSYTLDYPFGHAKELNWGSFVFILGFPNGHKVLTRALVSSPNRDKNGSFIVDSFFNMGFSGGLVLALRDGIPNFEIVGMLHSAAGEQEAVLIPDNSLDLPEGSIYKSEPVVHYQSNIKHGITFAVSAEAILELIKENKEFLLRKGLDFGYILKKAEQVASKR